MVRWYKRLADVPDVNFEGSPDVDRSRLPWIDATPELHSFEFEGRTIESLHWSMPQGFSTASPASQWTAEPREDESPSQTILRRMREALELPGETGNYHFAIQGCAEMLWKNHREEPWVVQEVERLCWLDIRLIEAHLETISFERDGRQSYYHVLSFDRLIYLYKREGYLYEALDVAKRAVEFDQQEAALGELQERIAALESEDGE